MTNSTDIILKVENISKQYRLGQVGTGTISHDLNRWWYKIRGRENPYLKIGEENNRSVKGTSDYVWALQDINFEVERGEVIGIIGKNGAGKSTLLKILSRVTAPTTGSIKTRGRIASLLEVGTGFHSEMTGRENIFLNGAILGMTKKEIASKIDEIITFSGCERYIDTPVKRYSSGMTVRLAFAVAAFLEPEILVVDEVLAVGDAEFQKKAIGKMQDISRGQGRTVVFVSHNMAAVKSLCTKGVVMENGRVVFVGEIAESVDYYTNICSTDMMIAPIHIDFLKKIKHLEATFFVDNKQIKSGGSIFVGQKITFKINIFLNEVIENLSIALDILDKNGELMSHLSNEDDDFINLNTPSSVEFEFQIETSPILYIPNYYFVNIWIGNGHSESVYQVKNFFSFATEQGDFSKRTKAFPSSSKVYLPSKWTLLNQNI